MTKIEVQSPNVTYSESHIDTDYLYQTTRVAGTKEGGLKIQPIDVKYRFRTERKVPKVGVMLVGWGGNNGSTFTAGLLANKHNITWNTKAGEKQSNFFGSIFQASTVSLGYNCEGVEQFVPFRELMPMIDPLELAVDGWDISSDNIADAMNRAEVLDYNLQKKLNPLMKDMKPRKAVYREDFIALNQKVRANHILHGSTQQQMEQIRSDIKDFKASSNVDKVIVLWTANTERFCDVRLGLNDTAANMLKSIENNEEEVSASTIYAVASILEGCAYINGSPQNTFVPGVIELAEQRRVFIGGDDFKSGQTKVKSVLVDFLVGAGIKPTSIVSYNHLGNNDGMNLSSPQQFRSKEISKSNVVDDMVGSNDILYKEGEKPDHCVVIKYIPYVGDSKRAMDEYTSEIFMHGTNTVVMHNTCEDSLLAVPIIFDLIMLTEICQRISFAVGSSEEYQSFNSVLSILSYLLKAPLVPEGTPVINALFKQRACIENVFRACIGLPPQNNMMLEFKMREATSFKTNMKVQSSVSSTIHEPNGIITNGNHKPIANGHTGKMQLECNGYH